VSWLWIAAAVVVLPAMLLFPKVYFSGSGSPAGFYFRLKAIGLWIEFDSINQAIRGRFLGFKIATPSKVIKNGTLFSQVLEKSQSATPADPTSRKKRSFGNLAVIRLIIPKILTLLKRLLGSIHIDVLSVELVVATEDPMTTAIMFGALQPVALWNTPRRTFTIGVDFERASPLYDLKWSFSARPIVWIWLVITWGFGLPWRRIWRHYRKGGIL